LPVEKPGTAGNEKVLDTPKKGGKGGNIGRPQKATGKENTMKKTKMTTLESGSYQKNQLNLYQNKALRKGLRKRGGPKEQTRIPDEKTQNTPHPGDSRTR